MSASSRTMQQDQRVAVQDAESLSQLTSPYSQIANPLGLSIGASDKSKAEVDIIYRDVYYNDVEQIGSLINSLADKIITQQQETLGMVSNTTESLSDIVVETKTPLAKYLPFAVLATVLILYMKWQ